MNMICPQCKAECDNNRRCRKCGASLVAPMPTVAPTPEASKDPTEIHWIGKFAITLICAYMFSVLMVLSIGEISWFVSKWYHLAHIATAALGIMYFHPITNWMRDYWDHENTNK